MPPAWHTDGLAHQEALALHTGPDKDAVYPRVHPEYQESCVDQGTHSTGGGPRGPGSPECRPGVPRPSHCTGRCPLVGTMSMSVPHPHPGTSGWARPKSSVSARPRVCLRLLRHRLQRAPASCYPGHPEPRASLTVSPWWTQAASCFRLHERARPLALQHFLLSFAPRDKCLLELSYSSWNRAD